MTIIFKLIRGCIYVSERVTTYFRRIVGGPSQPLEQLSVGATPASLIGLSGLVANLIQNLTRFHRETEESHYEVMDMPTLVRLLL